MAVVENPLIVLNLVVIMEMEVLMMMNIEMKVMMNMEMEILIMMNMKVSIMMNMKAFRMMILINLQDNVDLKDQYLVVDLKDLDLVVGHQVNLNINHLAGSVAPRYGSRGKPPPRHVILGAAVVVTAQPAPPAVHGVELDCEASTVERVVVPVLEREREDMITPSNCSNRITIYLPWASYSEVLVVRWKLCWAAPARWNAGLSGRVSPATQTPTPTLRTVSSLSSLQSLLSLSSVTILSRLCPGWPEVTSHRLPGPR